MNDNPASVIRHTSAGRISFHCPACKHGHTLTVDRAANGEAGGACWTWNGSEERPTITPSVLVHADDPDTGQRIFTCHSYITDGQIQFLGDCTHELANQTVPLKPNE